MIARRRVVSVTKALVLFVPLVLAGCSEQADRHAASAGTSTGGVATRIVTDMRGVGVAVPARLQRVATINDGFVESVMTRFGVIGSLVAVASGSLQRTWNYTIPAAGGRPLVMTDGMGTMRAMHPWLANLPCAGCGASDALNYETIAAAQPDAVIMRVGDCTVDAGSDAASRTIEIFGAMGIPVVVLRSPTDFRSQSLETLHEEVRLLGTLFGQEDEAATLIDELTAVEAMVRERLSGVTDDARPRVLYLGLASGARSSGGAAYVWGTDTAESWMLEHLAGARNAYRGPGARVLLNAEQILALDPDVIVLPTSAGYHPPQELAEAPYFRDLQRLRAVRDRRVYSLPWTPMNCGRRLEYPLDLLIMAKGAHPRRFADVAVHDWALAFYRRTYRIDERQALVFRRAQWIDWTVDAGF
ncbi:MAG: ABC transporter substrate-binding protein [Vicinamibacterales bacterium]|nr:ABC transporter substrate-binding protein [Vicinamibacterales bacterium]